MEAHNECEFPSITGNNTVLVHLCFIPNVDIDARQNLLSHSSHNFKHMFNSSYSLQSSKFYYYRTGNEGENFEEMSNISSKLDTRASCLALLVEF